MLEKQKMLMDTETDHCIQLARNQQVTFLSDGGESVREVQMHLNPDSEHWLAWFHVTMRITAMGNMAKSLKWGEVEDRLEPSGDQEPERSARERRRGEGNWGEGNSLAWRGGGPIGG